MVNNINDDLKVKNYNEIVELWTRVNNDPEWKKVPTFMDHVYSGGGSDDIDYISVYYNQPLNKAIRFIINHTYKTATVQNVPVNELHMSDLDAVSKKIK